MRAYKTLSSIDAVTGALRTFDLLGQLPLREPSIAIHDPLHDWAALADDWQAVAEDCQAAFKVMLDDPALQGALHQIPHAAVEQLQELRGRWEEVREAAERLYHDEAVEEAQQQLEAIAEGLRKETAELHDQQMTLFGAEVEEEEG